MVAYADGGDPVHAPLFWTTTDPRGRRTAVAAFYGSHLGAAASALVGAMVWGERWTRVLPRPVP